MKTPRKPYKLQNRLTVLVICICVAALLAEGAALIVIEARTISSSAREDICYALRQTNENLDTSFQIITNAVRDIRDSNDFSAFFGQEPYEADAVEMQLAYLADLYRDANITQSGEPFLDVVYLLDASNKALRTAYTPTTQRTANAQTARVQLLNASFQNAGGQENWQLLRAEDQLVLLVRLFDADYRYLGNVCFGINIAAIDAICSDLDKYAQSGFALCCGGECLAGNSAFSGLSTGTVHGEEAIMDGKPYLIDTTELLFGMTSITVVPKSEVTKIIRPTILTLTLVVAVMLPLIATAAVFIVRYATRPLQAVEERLRQVGDGDFTTRFPPSDSVEFDRIGSTFNDMTGRIQRLITEVYETQLIAKENEIKYLQSQIDPHFMFNILAMIALSAKQNGSDEEYRMLHSLSRLMRGKIFRTDGLDTTLGEELELLDYYLFLQCSRYSGRMQYHIECNETLRGLLIPRLSIEPIAENAFLHGVEPKGAGCIRIQADEKDGSLIVTVSDDGVGFNPSQKTGGEAHIGVGLINTQKLLQNLYGEAGGVHIASTPGSGTVITIRFPIRREGA